MPVGARSRTDCRTERRPDSTGWARPIGSGTSVASSSLPTSRNPSDLDRVPVDVGYIGVRHTWSMLAPFEEMAAGLLHQFDRSVDCSRRTVPKMNAEMLEAALPADAGALVIGDGQVKRERVAPAWRAHEDNVAITKLFFHAERLGIEGDGTRTVSHQEVDVTNADRSQGSSSATDRVLLNNIMPPRRSSRLAAAPNGGLALLVDARSGALSDGVWFPFVPTRLHGVEPARAQLGYLRWRPAGSDPVGQCEPGGGRHEDAGPEVSRADPGVA